MSSAAGDTPAENTQSNNPEDGKSETNQTESKETSVQVVESKLSHPNIFDPDAEDNNRDVWRWGCLFTIVILAAGLWLKAMFRLPQLLLKHSGGAFIIAFLCTIIFLCIPLACLETFTGQYGGKPFLLVMGEVIPVARGVGFAIVVDNFLEVILYGVNLSQMFMYCFFAFKSPVPWEKCDASYNTMLCATDRLEENCLKDMNKSGYLNHKCVPGERVCQTFKLTMVNESHCTFPGNETSVYIPMLDRPTAQEEYYEGEVRNHGKKTLETLNGLDGPSIKILSALGAVWFIAMLGALGGLRPQPYIAFVLSMIPLLGYMTFMFYALSLDGAGGGISHMFHMDGKDLASGQCWADAAGLAFACMSVGYGTYPSLAAKNRTRRRSYCDVIVVGVICIVLVLVTTLGFYGLVGSQAKVGNLTIAAQLEHGCDMARVLLPTALGRTGLPKIWTPLYLFTIATFGVGSMVLHIACVISDISSTCQFKCHTAVTCFVVLLFGLSINLLFSFGGTIFVLDTIEDSILGSKKIILSLLFLLVVIFLYGPRNLIHHVRKRQRIRLLPPPFFWQLSWYMVCPLGLLALPALAVLGRGGTFFRDDVPLWVKLLAVGYEFYYWLIILGFLVQTAVAWRRPTRPRGVWRLETDPDDDDDDAGGGSKESVVLKSEVPANVDSQGNISKHSVAASDAEKEKEAVEGAPAAVEGAPAAGPGGEAAAGSEEDLTLPGEKRRAAAATGAVDRIRGLEREPGPDEADLFVRLHSWSRGPPPPPTPPPPTPPSPELPPPSPPPPPPRLPSVDSIQTEYANFMGRQSPTMRARGLPVPEQERIEEEGASRLPWQDEQLRGQFGPNLVGLMSPFTRRGLFGRGRVSAEPPGSRSPERAEPRRAASVAATIPEEGSEPPPKDTSEDTPSLMDMLRNMKS